MHKSSMACSLRVSNQFPSMGNELSVQGLDTQEVNVIFNTLNFEVACTRVHFPNLETACQLQVNKVASSPGPLDLPARSF